MRLWKRLFAVMQTEILITTYNKLGCDVLTDPSLMKGLKFKNLGEKTSRDNKKYSSFKFIN